MSQIVPVESADTGEAEVVPVVEEKNNTGKPRKGSLLRAGTQYFGVDTLIMYKKVKDVHVLRQLCCDIFIWISYAIVFVGFILSFYSIKHASSVTNSLDLYFSTTDNPEKNAAAWVDIQTEPDLWHYIDNVLVEELLFGEEYELSDHGDGDGDGDGDKKAGGHRKLAGTKVKGSTSGGAKAKHGTSGDTDGETSGGAKHPKANHSHCDPDHLDDGVTLHYLKNSNVVAGGILMIQQRFTPAGKKFNKFDDLCHDGSHFYKLEGKILPCALPADKHDDTTAEVHGFNDPKVYKDLPGFKWNSASDATNHEGYHIDGYIIEIKIDHGETAEGLLKMLKEYEHHHWLDEYTQDVVIEVALYNNNLKLWVEVHLEAIFDMAGNVKAKHHVQSINLEPYNLNNWHNVQRIVFEVLFIIVFIFMLVIEIMQIASVKCNCSRYFGKYGVFSSLSDLSQLFFSLFLICFWLYSVISPHEHVLAEQLSANTLCHPPDMHHIILWEEWFLTLCCVNIMIILLRGLKFLLFVKSFAKIFRLLQSVLPDFLTFTVPLAGIGFFVALFGHIKYGKDLHEWSTIFDSLFTVFQWLFNMYDFTRIYDLKEEVGHQLLEIVFIVIITFIISILMVNVMLAILVAAWDEINGSNEDEEGLTENHSLIASFGVFKTYSDMAFMIFNFRDEDFLAVTSMLKNEHPSPMVNHVQFEDLCERALKNKDKAKAMVYWFFSDSGEIITKEMIEDIRTARNNKKPKLPYLFQRIAVEKQRVMSAGERDDMDNKVDIMN